MRSDWAISMEQAREDEMAVGLACCAGESLAAFVVQLSWGCAIAAVVVAVAVVAATELASAAVVVAEEADRDDL